jgi:hypothetical protein
MATKSALSLYAETPEDERVVQEYKDQQKMLMDSLVNRQQLFDPTLLAMAQGFLSPTKTGSFGESLGNVASAVAPVQQAEEQRAREIAKMRFDMAQQNLQTHQATAADKAFRELIPRVRPPVAPPASGEPSASGASTSASLAGPNAAAPSQDQFRPITSVDIARLAKMPNGGAEAAKILQNMVTMNRDQYKFSNDMIVDLDAPGGPKVIADMRVNKQEPSEIVVDGKPLIINMTPTELRDFQAAYGKGKGDEYYEKNLKGRRTDVNLPSAGGALMEIAVPLLGDVVFRGTPKQAAMVEKLTEEALATGNPSALRAYVNAISQKMAMPAAPAAPSAAPAPLAAPAAQGQPPAAKPPQPAPQAAPPPAESVSDLSGLPLADQNKTILERLSLADKPAQDTMAVLMKSAGPETTIASNQRLTELVNIINQNPRVVGLMNQQGLVAGAASAAQQGIQVGNYSVSLPVTTFLEKAKLSPSEQQVARRVAQLLDQEFFTRAALAKSALGPQISNVDAIAMRSPMARPEDGAQLIKYWSLHGVLVNRQNDALVNSYNSWLDGTKGKQPTRQFWNTEGRKILNQYTPYFEKLEKDFSPTGSR